MKRVFLSAPDTSLALIDPDVLRLATVALARFAVNGDVGRDVGDPVYDWVTEGRHGPTYSSCGDLGAWLLMCLGCRDERVVNRTGDAGEVPWRVGLNITILVSSPWYVRATPGVLPKSGDITHVRGSGNSDHIAVLESLDAGELHSFDYGQPGGRSAVRKVHQSGNDLIFGARMLRGWIDLERVTYTKSAIVPNDFDGGVVDDCPYPEALIIPAGVP